VEKNQKNQKKIENKNKKINNYKISYFIIMIDKLKEINKKLINLNKETDEALEKIAEQTEKLNQNEKDLTYMTVNLNFTLTLLKSIKYKINPFQYINSPNIDLDVSNLFKFKKNKKVKIENEKNEELEDDNDRLLEIQIMNNLNLLKEKQDTINKEINNQILKINSIENQIDKNSDKINSNNNLIDDLI
jgi:hypothetical protein